MRKVRDLFVSAAIAAALVRVLLPITLPVLEAQVGPATLTGIIAYFNGTACPPGWAEFTDARGLYVVARVSGGTLDTAVGTALTNQENRTHTHSVPGLSVPSLSVPSLSVPSLSIPTTSGRTSVSDDDNHVHGNITGGGDCCTGGPSSNHDHPFTATIGGSTGGGSTGTGSTGSGTSGGGTTGSATGLAPYIQLLACKHN